MNRAFSLARSAESGRARALADGRIWIEAALISNGVALIYADSRKTRDAACGMLLLLRALRRVSGLRIISWKVSP